LEKNLRLKSYAKLNLYLQVRNIRRDNYHNIITLFEKISLHDEIRIKPRRDGKIRVTCNNKDVPSGEANLAYRAAYLLRQKAGIDNGADIHINKRIPVAAGLGGGSSNAASAILGLNRLWNLNFSREKLLSVASQAGCDVPFFLYDTSFALGTGRGDKIKALPGIKGKLWHVLVAPDMPVSTPLVYKELDRQSGSVKKSRLTGLTKPPNNVKFYSWH
jgi:4-diphosphocytidyl-2-C-methyl-D-erythritol kinase